MKKVTIILVSMLLVLSIGQAALAKDNANVNLAISYGTFESFEGFSVEPSGGYKFNDWFSLEGDLLFAFGFRKNNGHDLRGFVLDTDILAKFHLYEYGYLSVGLQAGIKNCFVRYDDTFYVDYDPVTEEHIYDKGIVSENTFSIGSGFFFDLYFAPKTKLYLNMLIPLFLVKTRNGATDTDFHFSIDMKVGVNYEINSNFNVGVEFIGSTDSGISTIGAKIGYKF